MQLYPEFVQSSNGLIFLALVKVLDLDELRIQEIKERNLSKVELPICLKRDTTHIVPREAGRRRALSGKHALDKRSCVAGHRIDTLRTKDALVPRRVETGQWC
jgi:hypothetical protein